MKLNKFQQEIVIDLQKLHQDRTDRVLARGPAKIIDLAERLEKLAEFNVLSAYARKKKMGM